MKKWLSFTGALAIVVVLALGAGTALAHVQVDKTKSSKKSVSIIFTGPIQSGTLKVTGPGGKASKGSGGRDPRKISRLAVDLKKGLKGGSYTAKWKIIAGDGHNQNGSFSFSL